MNSPLDQRKKFMKAHVIKVQTARGSWEEFLDGAESK